MAATFLSPDEVRAHIIYKRDLERRLDPAIAERMLQLLDAGAEPDYHALWLAAAWPEPPAHLFHTASVKSRRSIATGGLEPRKPWEGNFANTPDAELLELGQPIGVYAARRIDFEGKWSHWRRWDVWRIETAGSLWQPDLLNPECWSTPEPVPPARLHLLAAGHRYGLA